MPNLMQKLIYNLSAAAPLFLIFAVVWKTQRQGWLVPCICCVLFVVLLVAFVVSFNYGKKHLPPTPIHLSDVSPHDMGIIAYTLSYALPFASMAVDDINLGLSGAIAFAIVLLAPFANSAIPNPLLAVCGYHFYQVSSEHGVSGYVLISKRKLRNPNAVKAVKRIFEFLLFDEEAR